MVGNMNIGANVTGCTQFTVCANGGALMDMTARMNKSVMVNESVGV